MSGSNTGPQYYKSLDGLRAVAIVMVFLFHLDIPGFEGGYLGVDLFFVISGFIVTKVTLDRWDKECLQNSSGTTGEVEVNTVTGTQFDWKDFALRRIKRLWPEVYVVMGVVVGGGVWVWGEGEWLRLPLSALTQSLLVSNFRFWSEPDGYFGLAAKEKPLLHMWSLSVEGMGLVESYNLVTGCESIARTVAELFVFKHLKQFYIVFAVTLRIFGRRSISHNTVVLTLSIFFAGSLASSVILRWSSMAFYLLPFRAWQLIAGVLAALWQRKSNEDSFKKLLGLNSSSRSNRKQVLRNTMEMTGIFIILWTMLQPELFGALAVILMVLAGVSLILLLVDDEDSDQPTLIQGILSCRLSTMIGELSYSIYLWHWPVICFVHKVLRFPHDPLPIAGNVTGTLVLAALSHNCLTKKIRAISTLRIRQSKLILPLSFLFLLSLNLACYAGYFIAVRRYKIQMISAPKEPPKIGRVVSAPKFSADDWILDPCKDCNVPKGNCSEENDRIMVIGDSNAFMFAAAFDAIGKERRFCIHLFSAGSCVPFITNFIPPGRKNKPLNGCIKIINNALDEAKKRPKKLRSLFLMASWELYMFILVLDLVKIDTSTAELRIKLYKNADDLSKRQFKDALRKSLDAFMNYTEKSVVFSAMPSYHKMGWPLHCRDLKECVTEYESDPKNVVPYLTRDLIKETLKDYDSKSVVFADLTPVFCSKQRCSPYINGTLAYVNTNHLNVQGARQLSEFLSQFM